MSEVIQGTDEWRALRAGKVTASRIADMMAKTKTGYAASRTNYAAQLVAERLSGVMENGYSNAAMQWGKDNEADARVAYQFRTDKVGTEVGFVDHPSIPMSGCSPDGLVGDDGLVEIKAPNTATHINSLLDTKAPAGYLLQMQWQLSCTGRKWCDFVSYDPRLPEAMQMVVFHVKRDDALIADLEKHVLAFVEGIDATVTLLRSRYGEPA